MGEGTRLPGTPEPMLNLVGASGLRIAADEWGDKHAPLVLLLHGGGQTRHAWKGTGEALSKKGFHAVALDARGHGDSAWAPDGDYGQTAMVDDLVAVSKSLSEHLEAPRPILVGASMGGGVSLCAVGLQRLNAAALVLVDTAPQIEKLGAQRILEFMGQNPDGFDSLEEVATAISSYQPHRSQPKNLDGLKKNVRLDENGRIRWHWDPAYIGGSRPNIDKRRQDMQIAAEKLAHIKTPTQLVRGGLSDVLSEEGAQSFLQVCPHAEYVNVTDAAHMVAGDRNDIFTDAVSDFLDRTLHDGKSSV